MENGVMLMADDRDLRKWFKRNEQALRAALPSEEIDRLLKIIDYVEEVDSLLTSEHYYKILSGGSQN